MNVGSYLHFSLGLRLSGCSLSIWENTTFIECGITGSNPVYPTHGGIAQSEEHLPCTQRVAGSIPASSTNKTKCPLGKFGYDAGTVKEAL